MAEEAAGIGRRIKSRRRELDLSLRDLAGRADLTASFLSQVERGKANVSIDSLRRISEALDVSMLHFLESGPPRRDLPGAASDATMSPTDGPTTPSKSGTSSAAASGNGQSSPDRPDSETQRPEYSPVLRADARPKLIFPDTGVIYELLTPDLGHQMEAICGHLSPGVENVVRPLREPTEEWILVVSGHLKVGLEDGDYILAPGDSIYFEGYALRELVCAGAEEAVWISVITPPVF